jgi:hypothetical protein
MAMVEMFESDAVDTSSVETESIALTEEDKQELSARVYALLREDLRIERERLGEFRKKFG